jgi:pimeloyl-ACP methyl ester carboxylesterase
LLAVSQTDGAGPPVVLLHELGGSAWTFRWLGTHLTGHRVLALDLPGTGGSPRVSGEPTLTSLSDAVGETLRSLLGGEPAVVVGVAGGAGVAATLAARESGLVSALVYCSLGAGLAPETVDYIRARVPVVRSGGMAAVVDPSLARSFPERLRTGREEVYAAYRQAFVASDVDGYVDQQLALARDADELAGRLDDVVAPAVVLGGQVDELFPPAALDAAAARLRNLVARVNLPGVAHLPHLQAPAALAATVDLAIESTRGVAA